MLKRLHPLLPLQDGNLGLLNLALEARTKRAIQRLTQTYLTLSLQQIAENANLPSAEDAEHHLLRYGIRYSKAICEM